MCILIRNAKIYDGTGAPAKSGDVLVQNGFIGRVAPRIEPQGLGVIDKIIDATGLSLSPGFIDTHSHSDLKVLEDPFLEAKIRQGITTEVLGQDGISMAPLPAEYLADWQKNIAGLDGKSDSLDWNYETTDGYLSRMERSGVANNMAYLAPHGNIRMEAMGLEDRPATPAEVKRMREITRREMEAGAYGLSSGLIYIPCAYGDTEEIIAMCEVVAEYGGVFVVHQRSEANNILSSMEEIIRVGRESGVKIHYSHFKVCGKNNWDKLDRVVELLENAAAEGITVSYDQYPYTAGSTMMGAMLPPWAHSGGTGAMLARLRDPAERARIVADILAPDPDWDNFVDFAGLEGIFVTDVASEANKKYVGKNLVELGAMRGREPLEAALDLLLEEENAVGMIDHYGKEEHIVRLLKRPEQNLCTDGLLGGRPHPRVFGSFPRLLGRYARDGGIMSIEEAVHKMTLKAATAIGIRNRGKIEPGWAADLVIFDEKTVIDTATYEEPERYPKGIESVLVNGHLLLHKGAIDRSARRGSVLRRK